MNTEEKKAKLRALNDEIRLFHPLLDELFRSMKEIKAVDYTHGNNEKGADFVLTRYDDILAETYYIGVIVKCGKIAMDFTDIERQIDECTSLPRYTLSGKKTVTITEIWVITNESVSANAELKIHEKFKNKKIEFIENQKIICWIDANLKNYWNDYGIKTGKYLDLLHHKILEIDKSLNLVKCTTEPFYIEQDIYEQESGYKQNTHEKPKKVSILEHVLHKKITIIDAGMGGGKSKLLRRVAKHFSDGEIYSKEHMLPIIVSYNDLLVKYDSNIQKVLEMEIGKETLEENKENGKILLLIDAIDEWKTDSDNQIEKLAQTVNIIHDIPNVNAVLTTRPLRGFDEQKDLLNKVTMLEIRPLSLSRIIEFLKKICVQTNISSRLIEDLKKSQLFKELPKTPIAAMILANLLNENSKELPANITELYSKYTELMLGRWDIEKGLQSQKEYEAADSASMLLAEYFIDNSLSTISIAEAKEFFNKYLQKRNLSIESDVLYNKVVNRSGLLVENPFNKTVLFKHRTFAEFLYAKYHERKNDLLLDEKIYDIYWDTVYFFYIGIKRDCPELLNYIFTISPKNDAQRWNRIINLSSYLLAGYASPYEVVTENLHKIMIEASILFTQIVKKEIKSPFSFFPEIHLLCLIQMIIRGSYAYDYFKKAIESVNLQICESAIETDQKYYALFFTAVTAMDLGEKNPFDFMLETFGDKIPLQVKLAISHEAEGLKHLSNHVTKNIKKLKQTAKASHSTRSLIEMLYEKPIELKQEIKGKLRK